jgi:hypothetical protein
LVPQELPGGKENLEHKDHLDLLAQLDPQEMKALKVKRDHKEQLALKAHKVTVDHKDHLVQLVPPVLLVQKVTEDQLVKRALLVQRDQLVRPEELVNVVKLATKGSKVYQEKLEIQVPQAQQVPLGHEARQDLLEKEA